MAFEPGAGAGEDLVGETTHISALGHKRSLTPIRIDAEAKATYERFFGELAERFDDPELDDNDTVRDVLAAIYGLDLDLESGPPSDSDASGGDSCVDAATATFRAGFDPRNVTLEPEYYSDCDREKYLARKPLIWLWIMFDRSPLGHNVYLGTQLRALLAKRIFRSCGDNVRIFRDVEFTYGYNLSVGDNVIIHHHVFIDDRGEVIIHDGSSLSDYANVYSHSHSIEDIQDVSLARTEIGPHARVTYHSTVLSGVRIGEDAMLGSHGLATRDVPDHAVSGGVPARELARKSGKGPRTKSYVPRSGVDK